MTPSRQLDETELADILRGLAQGLGIRRENLYGVLGEDLRELWFIFPGDRQNKLLLQQKVDCHLHHHISLLSFKRNPVERKRALWVAFNLKETPESVRGNDFTDRVKEVHRNNELLGDTSSYDVVNRMIGGGEGGGKENRCESLARSMIHDPLSYEELAGKMKKRFGVPLSPRVETSEAPQPSTSRSESPEGDPDRGDFGEDERKRNWWKPGITLTATGVPAILVALAIIAWTVRPFPFGNEEPVADEDQGSSTVSESPSLSPLPTPSPGNSGNQNDCPVYGDGSSAECNITNEAPEYPNFAGVDLFFDYGSFVFTGPPEDLPTPPSISVTEQRGHCDDWHDWVREQENFYIDYPTIIMQMETGVTEILTVTDFEVNVMGRNEPPAEMTRVTCQMGAGLNVGYWIGYDTRTREGQYFDDAGDEKIIPPATFSLQQGEYENAGISLTSESGLLYSGVLNVTSRVDGAEVLMTFGTEDNPIRWVGREQSGEYLPLPDLPGRVWNASLGEWSLEFPELDY